MNLGFLKDNQKFKKIKQILKAMTKLENYKYKK